MAYARSTVLASCLFLAAGKKSVGNVGAAASCYWHVTDQRIQVEKPVLYDMQVERQCAHDDYGTLHKDICTECEAMDNPCGGEFVACAGCCDQRKNVRYHPCENIKKYFFDRNAKTLECDARMDLDDGDVNMELGDETENREEAAGVLKASCEVDVMDAEAEGIPVKLKFDCNNCATQGVPNLLKQCCDKASSWTESTHVQKLKSQGFTVFVWADGCHDSWIGPDDNQVEFKHSYPSLKEEKITRDMHSFIEQEYCSKSVKPETDRCPAGGGYSRRLMEDPTWQYNSSQLRSTVSKVQFNSSRQLSADEDCDWSCDWLCQTSDATLAVPFTALLGVACALHPFL